MGVDSVFSHDVVVWVILPLAIFFARVVDVSLGTIRIVFVSREFKNLAPVVGFFEVIIWLVAIRTVMQNVDNVAGYFAYGAGFAMGTLVGLMIETKMAVGNALIRVITQEDASEMIERLRSLGYGVTSLEAQGKDGIVHVMYSIIRRSDFERMAAVIRQHNPRAFFTLENVCFVSQGTFPPAKSPFGKKPFIGPFRFFRKSK